MYIFYSIKYVPLGIKSKPISILLFHHIPFPTIHTSKIIFVLLVAYTVYIYLYPSPYPTTRQRSYEERDHHHHHHTTSPFSPPLSFHTKNPLPSRSCSIKSITGKWPKSHFPKSTPQARELAGSGKPYPYPYT